MQVSQVDLEMYTLSWNLPERLGDMKYTEVILLKKWHNLGELLIA